MRAAYLTAVLVLFPTMGLAQQAEAPPADQQAPRVEERVEVVGITPIHGLGVAKFKVPSNVQAFTAEDTRSSTSADVAALIAERAASVHVSEAQAGTFQPDLVFRGFVGSPLLGASEGLAVYQDGVRLNDTFGDTIQWDLLPPAAIASINVMPGSNALFGLNALGGALSIRTKDGFGFPGHRGSFTTGSFGRNQVDVESAAHSGSYGYFLAGQFTHESGWRDFSPSTVRRVFGDIAWRGRASSWNLGVTAASNNLTGNGAAPVDLLEADRDAVFTHPDRSDNDLALVTARGRRQTAGGLLLEGVAYFRHARMGTFNGDAGDEDARFDAVNNISDMRGRAAGATLQLTRTNPLWGRDNHLIVGGGVDAGGTRFTFATEWAHLTAERGTRGLGLFDEDATVDLHGRMTTGSAFVTNTWSATAAVAMTASARVNWTSLHLRDQLGTALNGDHRFRGVNPAAGVTYQLRRSLNVYGSYTQSSRVPTPVELTCADPEDPCRLPNAFVSDPPLEPIVARTWEAGLRGAMPSIDWALAGFATASRDDILFVSSGTLRGEGHFQNVARTRRRGIEASIDYEVAVRVSTFARYTLQRAAFGAELRLASRFHPQSVSGELAVGAGDRLPGVPTHTAKAGVTVVPTTRLSATVTVRAQSGQFLRGDEANLLAPLPGFTSVNAHLRHRITSRIAGVVQAQNIFNAAYYTFGMLGDAAPVLGDAFDDPRFYSPASSRAAWIGLEVQF